MPTLQLWTRPFTHLHKVPVFKRVLFYLALMTVYILIVDLIELNFPVELFKEAGAAGACGGIVLGVLLVFRTNSAYERWWEGRKLWGQLTNESRNICTKVNALVNISAAEKMLFGQLIISFAYALKHHLRGSVSSEPLPGVGEINEEAAKHVPLYISRLIYQRLAQWQARGQISEINSLMIDQHARAFMEICGGCERIKNSPIAVSYRAFMRQGIALNLLAWPWYLTQLFSCWSLPPLLLGAYFMIGIELIAEDIEEPFGEGGDDLPIENICTNIKNSVGSILPVEPEQKFTQSIEKPRLDLLKDYAH